MSTPAKANRGPSIGPDNRRALIAAARQIFTDDGYDAPFSAVAKRAGVGQGSLYRHFPDRVSLAVAVFDENLEELERIARQPGSTLDDLIDGLVEQALVSKALIDMITADVEDERVLALGSRVERVVATLADRARAEGQLAEGVCDDDIMLAISMLTGVLGWSVPEQRRAVAERAWGILRVAFAPR